MSDDQIAKDIVRASLTHVPFDGWHMTSLQMGASDCGLGESDVTRLFPQGVPDAISLYAQIADEDMVTAFHALEEMPERTPAKIKALIMARLSLAQAHKETVSKTVSYLASPQQALWQANCSIIRWMSCGGRQVMMRLIHHFIQKEPH